MIEALWVVALVLSIAQCCRRRPAPVLNISVTFVLPAESAPPPAGDDEAWLRRRLDGLGP